MIQLGITEAFIGSLEVPSCRNLGYTNTRRVKLLEFPTGKLSHCERPRRPSELYSDDFRGVPRLWSYTELSKHAADDST